MTDLELAYAALSGKQAAYNLNFRYYDGDHPLRYSTERLREIFQNIDARFVQNWCAVVVDAVADRLNLSGFVVADNDQATDLLNTDYALTQLNLDSDDAHLAALVCGEAFVIIWPDDETGAVQAYYNDPRLCHVQYDAANPREKRWAAKWWVADDGTYRLTLYYPDRLEYYATAQKAENVTSANAFVPAEVPTAPNPYGVIPVFHLRRNRRGAQSELVNAKPLQDAINKLLSDMMVSAEFGAFRQRYVISNADVGTLKNAPNEIWSIPAGDGVGQATQIGEFGENNLGNYTGTIDRLAASIAIITRTPKFYFYQQGGDPSGEALKTMEAPLVRKCQRYIERFDATWKQIAAFLLQLRGVTVDPLAIEPVWDTVESQQPMAEAQTAVLREQAGVSRAQALRELGYSSAQIAAMDEERQGEQASLGEAMLTAFDRGEGE
jgi:hypothetical protein